MHSHIESTHMPVKEDWTRPMLLHPTVGPHVLDDDYMNLRRTAARLDHSYFWLSRNYRRLGLRPSRVGGKLLFERKEVDQLLKRLRVGLRGRPKSARF